VRRGIAAAIAVLMAVSLAACGSGDSSSSNESSAPPVNNTQPVIVDAGPLVNGQAIGDEDVLFTTVTICVPGTTTCQTIDHIAVDTGSTGLRILASQLTLTLTNSVNVSGQPIGNCIQYADNTYQWGPVAKADIKMAGEVASSVPIQIVAPANFLAPPNDCTAGGTPAQTVSDLGANGILGVGLQRQDCGPACASVTSPPAVYFGCPSTGCFIGSVSVTEQLQNPVWMFPQDNNGLLIVLPQVGPNGAVSVSGSMIFGIGTQSDNALSGAQAQAADAFGNFTTTFNGVPYSSSFIDSGSNGLFFLDSATSGLPDCSIRSQESGFYCPASTANLSAINSGPNPNSSATTVSTNVAFSIANAATLFNSNTALAAFNNVGGSNPGAFDWGLPFFFGRNVFIGIEGQSTPAGVGPYWAY
jgi:Protein of unknown function (DUF3443)